MWTCNITTISVDQTGVDKTQINTPEKTELYQTLVELLVDEEVLSEDVSDDSDEYLELLESVRSSSNEDDVRDTFIELLENCHSVQFGEVDNTEYYDFTIFGIQWLIEIKRKENS